MFSKVMVLDIDMLGSWSYLGCLGYFKCTTVVFKDLAVNLRGLGVYIDTMPFYFFEEVN